VSADRRVEVGRRHRGGVGGEGHPREDAGGLFLSILPDPSIHLGAAFGERELWASSPRRLSTLAGVG